MRLVRFSIDEEESYGLIEDDVVEAIEGLPWEGIVTTGKEYSLDKVRLLPPVVPPAVWAIGLNYLAHAEEGGFPIPTEPVIFLKAASSVIGPDENIILPAMLPTEVDYEAELAIVIGRPCKNVSQEEALDYVLGYTCGNDVSARDAQIKYDQQWARAKSFDTFCPIGPWIEMDLDGDNVDISLKLNGKVMQSSNTSDMIFPCAKVVSYLSQIATLLPGTVILTGTPSGVGVARDPQVFMRPGDEVEVTIAGIGTLRNGVESDSITKEVDE
jgi:2-keto-4-pentenoate hydratase/2-oxohepta-3-ene-1,7-dioic acid hydratase in catechol pathway